MRSKRWEHSRSDRVELRPCCICGVAAGDCRDGGFVHAGRCWEIGITWPGNSFGDGGGLLDGVCRATVEDRYEPDDDDDFGLRYRGACCGCGWASERQHSDSNAALEDALDHTLGDWRRIPIVERLAHDAPATRTKQWLTEIGDLYTALGLENHYAPCCGGLIRTLRQPLGTCSHRSAGFYDVCAGLVEHRPAPVYVEQLGLF